MKEFIVDRLVNRENFCNFNKERILIEKAIANNRNLVVFAPRNYGKTSLFKNIIIEDFITNNKSAFVFFADLMEVKSTESLVTRLTSAFERSFERTFPIKSFLNHVKKYLSNMNPEVSIDPLTGTPSVSLKSVQQSEILSIQHLFAAIKTIGEKHPTLIVLDEFQDIVFIEEAHGILRSIFQEIGKIPICLLGSKRHMLSAMFSDESAPFFNWGIDIEFQPIPVKEYHVYIQERFTPKAIQLDLELCIHLQDLMAYVPEAINLVCQQILDTYQNIKLTEEIVHKAIKAILENRRRRFEIYLSRLSDSEEKVLNEIARRIQVSQPQAKDFVHAVNLTNRTVGKNIQRLLDYGMLEFDQGSYRLTDPLLKLFIQFYR